MCCYFIESDEPNLQFQWNHIFVSKFLLTTGYSYFDVRSAQVLLNVLENLKSIALRNSIFLKIAALWKEREFIRSSSEKQHNCKQRECRSFLLLVFALAN